MSDTEDKTTPSADPQPPASETEAQEDTQVVDEAPKERMYTKEEMETAIKERVKAERARANRKQKPEPKPASEEDDQFKEQLSQLTSVVQMLVDDRKAEKERETANRFDEEFSKTSIPEHLKEDLRAAAAHQGVSDVKAFLAERAKHYPAEVEAEPATPSPGATMPAQSKDFSGAINPMNLSREDVERLRSEGQLLSVVERWRRGNSAVAGENLKKALSLKRPPPW